MDAKINRKCSINKNKIQHNIEHQNSICNSLQTHSSNGIDPILSVASNYHVNIYLTSLYFHISIFRSRD